MRLGFARRTLRNERTLLAYVRTAIMLAATGVTLLNLYNDRLLPAASGWALIAAAIGVAFLGALRFQKLARSLN